MIIFLFGRYSCGTFHTLLFTHKFDMFYARPPLFWHFHRFFLIEIGHDTSDFSKSDMSHIRSDVRDVSFGEIGRLTRPIRNQIKYRARGILEGPALKYFTWFIGSGGVVQFRIGCLRCLFSQKGEKNGIPRMTIIWGKQSASDRHWQIGENRGVLILSPPPYRGNTNTHL